eukprot:tig00000254_g22508.t1
MYHFGVVRALFEAGLLPRVLSGSSAGALVCAAVACKTDEELPGLFAPGVIRLDFFDTAPGSAWRKVWRLLRHVILPEFRFTSSPAVLGGRGSQLSAYSPPPLHPLRPSLLHAPPRPLLVSSALLAQEAYDRTKRVLNITVSPTNKHQVPQLLNYLTAPNVVVWSAACASCALPGIFPAVELLAKDEAGALVPYHLTGMKWSDGSVEADLPMARLAEMPAPPPRPSKADLPSPPPQFNVNYFLVSQVNPHVLPFLGTEMERPSALTHRLKLFLASESASERPLSGRPAPTPAPPPGSLPSDPPARPPRPAPRAQVKHRFLQLAELELLPRFLNGFVPLFTQRYQGDITIFPSIGIADYQAREIWPRPAPPRRPFDKSPRDLAPGPPRPAAPTKVGIIRNHCRVELALDRCWRRLCERAAAGTPPSGPPPSGVAGAGASGAGAGVGAAAGLRSRSAPPRQEAGADCSEAEAEAEAETETEGPEGRPGRLRVGVHARSVGAASGAGSPLPHTPPSALSRVPSWVCMTRDGDGSETITPRPSPPPLPVAGLRHAALGAVARGARPAAARPSPSPPPAKSPTPPPRPFGQLGPFLLPVAPLPTLTSAPPLLAPVAIPPSPARRAAGVPPASAPVKPTGFAFLSVVVPPARPALPHSPALDPSRKSASTGDFALAAGVGGGGPKAAPTTPPPAACKGKMPAGPTTPGRRHGPASSPSSSVFAARPARADRSAAASARRLQRRGGGRARPAAPLAVIELFDTSGVAVAAAMRGLAQAGIAVLCREPTAPNREARTPAAPAAPAASAPVPLFVRGTPEPEGGPDGDDADGATFSKHCATAATTEKGGARTRPMASTSTAAARLVLEDEMQRALERAAAFSGLEAAAAASSPCPHTPCPVRVVAQSLADDLGDLTL